MSFWYLASPYSKYPFGRGRACQDVCVAAGHLIACGIPVFCPIAHSHPIAEHGGIDPVDCDLWLGLDEKFMEAASGLIVFEMTGWRESEGVQREIEYFTNAGKPIYYMSEIKVPELFKENELELSIGN